MPRPTRRPAQTRAPSRQVDDDFVTTLLRDGPHEQDLDDDSPLDQDVEEDEPAVDEEDEEDEEEDEAEEGEEGEDDEPEIFPPLGLKEISSLASWTVSSAKPGNGVVALRSQDTSLFWQSDGPQPHLLSIHFFKLVSIVHMRIFLDFDSDESYTPTKIQFLAGIASYDMIEFAEMSFEQPTGWIDVDFSNVGPIEPDEDDGSDSSRDIDWSKRPVLRAFIVQIRILENHQNGKDTHLRGVQLFARDETYQARSTSPAKSIPNLRIGGKLPIRPAEPNNINLASWMREPDLR